MPLALKKEILGPTKPILKWVGGKTQLLGELGLRLPSSFNKYIEPFFGGGALFFGLQPQSGIISDSNPELINLYNCIAKNPNKVIKYINTFHNSEEFYYSLRSQSPKDLEPFYAAARTIYLNKTCFNGLYRVNKKGEFNVPFGRYKKPSFFDKENLENVSILLKNAKILCADYKDVLWEYSKEGDLIFLDPPYLPISKYSDFKRYTKEQFYEEDQRDLAYEVERLVSKGCHVLLTNSNHPLIHELYGDYKIEVLKTKRYVNSDSSNRTGEDIIVSASSRTKGYLKRAPLNLPDQVAKFPTTRWMGSKSKMLIELNDIISRFEFSTAIDLFAGSGIVSYLLKSLGKSVISNDYLSLSSVTLKATIENNNTKLSMAKAKSLLKVPSVEFNTFVQDTFKGLYFSDEDNLVIDVLRNNIKKIRNPYEKAIALTALTRSCTKRRPRGIFTYVGNRYDDGRKDLKMSISEHFIEAVKEINDCVFDNGTRCLSNRGDAMDFHKKADLVYIDPPYFSPLSDNEYVRRYHFVEGLSCDWLGLEIQEHTKTKKFKNYPTPFSSERGAYDAFDKLFKKFKASILIVSYSSNSKPTLEEMVELLSKYKERVEVKKVDYTYSFGTQKVNQKGNLAKEYIFIAY